MFLANYDGHAAWIDLYDDWSLAPNIHPYYRLLAALGYRRVRQGAATASVITVNSEYLANLLLPTPTVLVPNGVTPELAGVPLEGSERTQLLLLGEFFPGRTDYGLMEQIALREEFEEVLVLGPGNSSQTAEVLKRIARQRDDLRIESWVRPEDLGSLLGPKAVLLIPHRVSDYTLSQDPLKAYQAMALGIKTICPRLLWPERIESDFTFLLDHGTNLDAVLEEFLERPAPDQARRRRFVARHSWGDRAARIAYTLDP